MSEVAFLGLGAMGSRHGLRDRQTVSPMENLTRRMCGMATCCKIRKCFDGGTLAFKVVEQCLSFQWSAFAVAPDHEELQPGGHLVRLLDFGARQKQTARSGSHNNEHASSNSRRGLRGDRFDRSP